MELLSEGDSVKKVTGVPYGVIALADVYKFLSGPRLPKMVGPDLPLDVGTVLIPFGDETVYRSLLTYAASLPAPAQKVKKEKRNPKTRKKAGLLAKAAEALEIVHKLTNQFCWERLDDEYATLCRQLAEDFASKYRSRFMRKRPETWAGGIVQTIAFVNDLGISNRTPHIELADLDHWFCVEKGTAQRRSDEIRRWLDIQAFDPEWTLPNRIEDHPPTWMLEVDGYSFDVRFAPREIQVIAFEKALIPHIPAERKSE